MSEQNFDDDRYAPDCGDYFETTEKLSAGELQDWDEQLEKHLEDQDDDEPAPVVLRIGDAFHQEEEEEEDSFWADNYAETDRPGYDMPAGYNRARFGYGR